MKYEDIKNFNQRCEEHPAHQTGMISHQMIQERLSEEIDELREYIEKRMKQAPAVYSSFGLMGGDAFVSGDSLKRNIT